MRALRLTAYFILGLLLGGYAVLSYAESFPVPTGYQVIYGFNQSDLNSAQYVGQTFGTWEEACALGPGIVKAGVGYRYLSQSSTNGPTKCGINVEKLISGTWYKGYSFSVFTLAAAKCPVTGGWTLVNGQCTRPDACPPSGTGTGTNEDKVSPSFPNLYGWNDPLATSSRGGAGTYCSAGCAVAFQATVCVQSTQAGTNNCAALNTTFTGATCTGTTAPVTSGNSSAKPPCAQGEGVVTMGGKVACVPVGASPDIPKVGKNSSTQTYPDGSTKITNTTTTCSGAGACSTTTTITNTGATSGPNAGGAGQAGEPGTTTGEGEESGDDEFCAKNPDLQICKGGISEEGTQKSVLAEIKKLTTAPTDTNFADGDDFDQPLEGVDGDAAQKLIDSYKSTTDALKVGFDDQNAPKSEPKFLEILGNWFDDVPQTGCESPEFAVAGHSLDLSGWCPTAEKISNIGAYALWFMTLVGLFVMVTGGKGNT